VEPIDASQSLSGILSLAISVSVVLILVGLLVALYWYYQGRLRAVTGDAKDIASLAAARDQYQAEIEQAKAWQSQAREELLRLDAEREAQERLRMELAQAEMAASEAEQKADEKRTEAQELQQAVAALADERDRLQNENQAASGQAERITAQIRELEQSREGAIQGAAEAQANADRLATAVTDLQRESERLQQQIGDRQERRDRLEAEARNLGIRQESMQQELARLESELSQAQAELIRAQSEAEPIREQIRERIRLEAEISELRSTRSQLEEETRGLEEAHGVRISSARYSDLFAVEPPCLADRVFPEGDLRIDSEQDALAHVGRNLQAQNLVFPQRTLNAFHTCLKVSAISPITVLAGISGTGKSELPLRYAEAMGMHSLPIAVQPSWSSPQDLFGFYNYLEKRYKATELARALVRMDPFNFSGDDEAFRPVRDASRSARMLLVLVDEMNLARIEYYFSEFLSKLEGRRAVLDPRDPKGRAPAEIEIEGAQRSGSDDAPLSSGIRLWVGSNVLFAGTMNEDESTQTLSDKVLDRANVLRFGKPPTSSHRAAADQRTGEFIRDAYLPYDTWRSWIRPVPPDSRWRRPVDEWIEQLNGALALIGRPFGWRVKDAIHTYVANYPGVEGGSVYRIAVADQVEQKVLPKLRGIDVSQQQATEALNIVESVLEQLDDDVLLEAVRECHQDATYGTFNWRGVTRS